MDTRPEPFLLIEDDSPTILLETRIIQRTVPDARVTVLERIDQALDFVATEYAEFAAGKTSQNIPDAVLLDLNMPGLSGWDFLDRYSQYPQGFRMRMKLAILSASPHPDDKVRARKYTDVLSYIVKPLSEHSLRSFLMDQYRS